MLSVPAETGTPAAHAARVTSLLQRRISGGASPMTNRVASRMVPRRAIVLRSDWTRGSSTLGGCTRRRSVRLGSRSAVSQASSEAWETTSTPAATTSLGRAGKRAA